MEHFDRDLLETRLNELTGLDLTKAEMRVRRVGDMTPDVSFSKRFQAEIAGIALKESPDILMTMPLPEFNEMCTIVSNFLLGGLAKKAESQAQDNNSDDSQ